MKELPIPPSLWVRIVEFLEAGRYGRIQLNVQRGRVVSVEFLETVKPSEDDACGSVAA